MLEIAVLDGSGPSARFVIDVDRLACLAGLRPAAIRVHAARDPDRRRVETFLEAIYADAFDGRIRKHYPRLMSLQDGLGGILAAVGFRFAAEEPLFLEQYLGRSAEQEIGAAAGAPVSREQVVEIGSLASTGNGAAIILFLGLAGHLRDLGCVFAAATATRPLRRIFRRAKFETVELARADPSRLPDRGADWGTYYAADPVVVAGAIAPALEPLARLLRSGPPVRGRFVCGDLACGPEMSA